MKNINEFASSNNTEIKRFEQSHTVTHESVKAELSECATVEINKVFEQLKTIFPAWSQAFPTQSSLNLAKNMWSKALIEAGVTSKEQLAIGFMKARRSQQDFMPSCGKFISWCKPEPEDFGLPPVDVAYAEVIRRLPPSHPIVVKTAKATSFERGTLTETEYKRVFARHYEILVERIMKGEIFDYEVPKGIGCEATHSPEYYTTKGKQGIATLRSMLQRKQVAYSPVLHGNEIAGLIDDEKS